MRFKTIESSESNSCASSILSIRMQASWCGILLVAATFLSLSGFLSLSRPTAVLSFLLPRAGTNPVPPFVQHIRDLSAGPTSLQQSSALSSAVEQRLETINVTGLPVMDNGTPQAIARADWFFLSGQDPNGLYHGQNLEISEGRMLGALKHFLLQRGPRLPVTTWTANLSTGGVMTGRVPPPSWAQSTPSDLALQGYISLVRVRMSDQLPELVRGTRNGAIMRPMEAALVAYVLMTADNGWIGSRRAQIDLVPSEIRSFLGDLGVQF